MFGSSFIREARLRGGLTQSELAERLGTTQSAVARWEAGGAEPAFHRVVQAIQVSGFDFVPQLIPRDDSEDRLIDYHLSLTPMQRVEALAELLRVREALGQNKTAR